MKKTVGMLFRSVVFSASISLATIVATKTAAFGGSDHLCDFAPPNKMSIPVGGGKANKGIDESTFNRVIDEVVAIYEPIIQSQGGSLKMNRLWTNATVNASAQRSGNTWVVNMYGGLARHEIVDADGFALVVCHELGHHLGGFPRSTGLMGVVRWASNEGQSDYFATMKCFRKVYGNDDNVAKMSRVEVPAPVTEKCSEQHKSAQEIALCERSSMGGRVLARLLNSLGTGGTEIDFERTATNEVSATSHSHPPAQCRLDTYFNGAACGVSETEDFGTDSAGPGACAEEKGDVFGVRPRCWYKPQAPSARGRRV